MILNAFHGVLHDMKDYRNIVFFAVFYVFFCKYGVFYILLISIPIRAESFEKLRKYDIVAMLIKQYVFLPVIWYNIIDG